MQGHCSRPWAGAEIFELTPVHEQEPASASHKARIQATLDILPKDCSSLLEVGCGPGYILSRIEQCKVFGTDLSRRSLKKVHAPVTAASAIALPFKDCSVHTVLCAEVLEHIRPVDLPRVAGELCRVAERFVVVSVPYGEDLLASSTRCPKCSRVFHLHGHRTSWKERDIEGLFPEARSIEFKGVWRARHFNRLLLEVRTSVLDLWKHTAFTACPRCGNTTFENQEHKPTYKLFNGLNTIVNPRKSKPNWLLAKIEI